MQPRTTTAGSAGGAVRSRVRRRSSMTSATPPGRVAGAGLRCGFASGMDASGTLARGGTDGARGARGTVTGGAAAGLGATPERRGGGRSRPSWVGEGGR